MRPDDLRAALSHGRQELEGKRSSSCLCLDSIGKYGHQLLKVLKK